MVFRFLWWFVVISLRVGWRRLWRGPKHPAWRWRTETLATLMRRDVVLSTGRSPQSVRRGLDKTAGRAPRPKGVRVERARVGGVDGEWLVPRDAEDDWTILYLHGGGYVIGSTNTHRHLTARVALASRARALSINYRLAPEHPFPAAIDDAMAVYRALLADDVRPDRIVLAGDSAGGGLAVAVMVRLRDEGEPLPAGAVLMSPWVDLTARGGSIAGNADYDYLSRDGLAEYTQHYLQGTDPAHPWASPALADPTGLPPILVQIGEVEILHDQVMEMVERMRNAGVQVTAQVGQGMFHAWQAWAALLPEGRAAIADVGAWVQALEAPAQTAEVPPDASVATEERPRGEAA